MQEIKNLNSDASVLSQLDYAYTAAGQIKQWTEQADSGAPMRYDLGYDKANQVTSAVLNNTSTNSVVKQYFYGYDAAANRTSEQIDTGVKQASYNSVNELTGVGSGSGPVRFQGTLNEAGTVTVNGVPATMTSGSNFVANPVLNSGTNTVAIAARDGSGNTRTNQYTVVVDAGSGRTLGYDAEGNMTDNGNGQTYEWDAAKRLVAINYASGSTMRTEFTYDGLGQRVKIVEKDGNGNPASTKQFVWSPGDTQPSEERDGSGAVTKRFYAQGEQIGGTSYYYTKDHLGSIRELTDGTGAIHARYDYDPYGRMTKVQGDLDSGFAYGGYYNHAPSGLYLTLYRGYNPDLERWISRDPIAERGGLNLYAYVGNDPLNSFDPLGLRDFWERAVQFSKGAAAATGGAALALGSPAFGPLAPLAAASGAIGMMYGLGNMVAAFAPDCKDESAKTMEGAPSNLGGAVGRALGGESLQAKLSGVENGMSMLNPTSASKSEAILNVIQGGVNNFSDQLSDPDSN